VQQAAAANTDTAAQAAQRAQIAEKVALAKAAQAAKVCVQTYCTTLHHVSVH
jgi:hypothetical protein